MKARISPNLTITLELTQCCPYCREPIQRLPPDALDHCYEHGILEGITKLWIDENDNIWEIPEDKGC